MPDGIVHNREYMQSRLREEVARTRRHGGAFALLIFEAVPSEGLSITQKMHAASRELTGLMRASDVLAQVFDDTLALLLSDTDSHGAHDALFRLRSRIIQNTGRWEVLQLAYPQDSAAIAALPFLAAA